MGYLRLPAPRGFYPGLVATRPRGYLPGMSGLGACSGCRGGLLSGLGSLLGSLELGMKESKLEASRKLLNDVNAQISAIVGKIKLPINSNADLQSIPYWQSLKKSECTVVGSGRARTSRCVTNSHYGVRQTMIDLLTMRAKTQQEIPLLEREVAHLRDLEAAKAQQQAVQQATQAAINTLPGADPALGPIPSPQTVKLTAPTDPALMMPQMPSLMPAQSPVINYVSPQPLPVTSNEIRDPAPVAPAQPASGMGPLLAAGGVAAAAYMLFG